MESLLISRGYTLGLMNQPAAYYLGIDAGATGAAAVLDIGGNIVRLGRFDKVGCCSILHELLNGFSLSTLRAAVESVHAYPGQGVSSTFSFGMSYGRVLGWLEARQIDYHLYSPQAWQRDLPLALTPKDRSKAYAERQWGLERFINKGCRVPHQGLIDAACIAEHSRRLSLGLTEAPRARPKPTRLRALKL